MNIFDRWHTMILYKGACAYAHGVRRMVISFLFCFSSFYVLQLVSFFFCLTHIYIFNVHLQESRRANQGAKLETLYICELKIERKQASKQTQTPTQPYMHGYEHTVSSLSRCTDGLFPVIAFSSDDINERRK